MKNKINKEVRKNLSTWRKWRLAFEAGDEFIQAYLKRFSSNETQSDFVTRRAMTFCPAFAKEAIVDVRNSIFQRLVEVRRAGDQRYLDACEGKNGGVDGNGTTMLQYMGAEVLDELLAMSKVAIWVDSSKESASPYLYMFIVEDILNWDDRRNPTAILLRDFDPEYDELGLEENKKEVYRFAKVTDNGVEVSFYDKEGKQTDETELLDLEELPLVILDIGESLMKEISNYQIALLNIASSDVNYTLRANFPIYVEQYDFKADMMKQFANSQVAAESSDVEPMSAPDARAVRVGTTTGIRHPIGTERPGYIAPQTDNLLASMEKQEQMKREIRILVNLSLTNISPNRSSSESKQQDEKGLEAGLAYIGQELRKAEQKIAKIWHEYLNSKTAIEVVYPANYTLKTDADRQAEADSILDTAKKLPSKTAQRELVKEALTKLFASRLSASVLEKIFKEIDEADILYVDPEILFKDIEAQLVSNSYASKLRGYPEGQAELAKQDHTDKLARIALAQSEAALVGKTQDAPGTPTLLTEKEKKQNVRDT